MKWKVISEEVKLGNNLRKMMQRMERVHHQQMSKLMTKNETKEKSFKSRITRLD